MKKLEDFSAWVCAPDVTVRDALGRINELRDHLFQVMVEADGRVHGTLTDGDVRRAMLRGVSLDGPVSEAMQTQPRTGSVGDDANNRAALSEALFLPIVDERGCIQHILVLDAGPERLRGALVMAGGFGKRLGERTADAPKPLLNVGGRPILDSVLSHLEDTGIGDIHIAVHYRAEQIEAFVASRENRARIHLVHEPEALGTAGALSQLPGPMDGAILVVNGDVVTQVDYAALREFHARHDYDGTIAVTRYEVPVPYGVVRQDDDGVFEGIDEKPIIERFVAAGIYVLSPQIVALTPGERAVDMPEVLNIAVRAGMRIGLFPLHEYWIDIGRPRDLETANADYAESKWAAGKPTNSSRGQEE